MDKRIIMFRKCFSVITNNDNRNMNKTLNNVMRCNFKHNIDVNN